MMKYTIFQPNDKQGLKNQNKKTGKPIIATASMGIQKLIVIAISASFIALNTAVSHAQMTMTGDGMAMDMDTTDMTDAGMDAMDDATGMDDSGSVVDLIENTDSEPPAEEPPAEEGGGGGGGGGAGAVLALVAVGAIVLYTMNRKKAPKIQKTFVSDQVSGKGSQLVEVSSQSSFVENPNAPVLSLQYGSFDSIEGFDAPFSFFNVRTNKRLGAHLNITGEAGTRLFFDNASQDSLANSQWLSLGLSSNSLFDRDDRLEFRARYAVGDVDRNNANLISQGEALENYASLFSDQNARFELAYSRRLGQNQRLRFLLQKTDSNSDDDYNAKVSWRYAF